MDQLLQRKNAVFAVIAVLGTLMDQASKAWVIANVELHRGEIMLIDGFMSIVHEQNHGAAFSSFEGYQGLFFVFTVIAVGVLVDLQRRLPNEALYMSATLGMILSGALGNFIDRIRFAYVTDFIRVFTDHPPLRDWLIARVGTDTYPIFNIADAAILVGVVLFLLHSAFNEDEDEKTEDVAEPATS
ncbi:MAG: signal peptidase II [Rhodobacterales bacterium]|nr:signal peptidase II [Rhodobacterales bacterium]